MPQADIEPPGQGRPEVHHTDDSDALLICDVVVALLDRVQVDDGNSM